MLCELFFTSGNLRCSVVQQTHIWLGASKVLPPNATLFEACVANHVSNFLSRNEPQCLHLQYPEELKIGELRLCVDTCGEVLWKCLEGKNMNNVNSRFQHARPQIYTVPQFRFDSGPKLLLVASCVVPPASSCHASIVLCVMSCVSWCIVFGAFLVCKLRHMCQAQGSCHLFLGGAQAHLCSWVKKLA